MTELVNPESFYVAGGTLRAGTRSYVVRRADSELFEHLQAGELCYVLTARQMGKSSLMVSTAKRLEADGIHAALVDLSQIGTERGAMAANSWYYGVAYEIHRTLRLTEPLRTWWKEQEGLPALQRLTAFFRELVLVNCSDRLVVFIDEIDSTIGLPWGDDFFASIRSCFNARAGDPVFNRLTFVLLGVASPSQLITTPARTPFNVGRKIGLNDFTLEEASVLASGLHADESIAFRRLQRIFFWTSGHPYLTQALCRAVEEERDNTTAPESLVDPLVQEFFLSSRAQRDETNIKHARSRLTSSGVERDRLLRLYVKIRRGQLVLDQPTSPLFSQLKLSGTVKVTDEGRLVARNRIYETVFTSDWAKSEISSSKVRRSAAIILMPFLIMAVIWYVILYPRPYLKALQGTHSDYAASYSSASKLRFHPIYTLMANDLMAQFWERRALHEASLGHRDQSLLFWLKALEVKDDPKRRKEVQALIGSDYGGLLATLRNTESITSAAFSPDGRAVLTGGLDGTARLWSSTSGQPFSPEFLHGGFVSSVAFGPNGKTLLTGGDPSLRVWDRAGRQIRPVVSEKNLTISTAFNLDGQKVFLIDAAYNAKIWAPFAARLLARASFAKIPGFPGSRRDAPLNSAFSPDGETVALGSLSGVWLWDWSSRIHRLRFLPHSSAVLVASFSPNGQKVLAGSEDGSVQVWEQRTERPLGPRLPQESAISALALSNDERWILTGARDGTVRMWYRATGRAVGPILRQGKEISSVAFSPDGRTILTGSRDGTARLWSTTAVLGGLPPLMRGALKDAKFAWRGRKVLTVDYSNTLRLWDPFVSQLVGPPLKVDSSLTTAVVSPDGLTIVAGFRSGAVRIWSGETGQPLGFDMQVGTPITTLALDPGGRSVLIGTSGGSGQLWDYGTGRPLGGLLDFGEAGGQISTAAFSPDGRLFLVGTTDGAALLWDIKAGKPIRPYMLGGVSMGDPVQAAAFSPDGKTILTGSVGGMLRLWSTEKGEAIELPLQPERGSILAAAFSPTGKNFIVATPYWLDIYAFDGRASVLKERRFLRGTWKGGFRFLPDCEICVQVALSYNDHFFFETIRFDAPPDPPVKGTAKELLAKWQKLLALRFNQRMDLVPRWSRPNPRLEDMYARRWW